MIPYKQLSLEDIFQDCQDKFDNDKPAFLSLLENHIDMDEIIPISFRNHFYASTGRTRKYSLHALVMPPLIVLPFIKNYCLAILLVRTVILQKHIYRLIQDLDSKIRITP